MSRNKRTQQHAVDAARFDYIEPRVASTITYRLEPHRGHAGQLLPELFLAWHRAWLLRMEVEELDIDGRPVTPLALARLNLWIQGDGAWRTSKLPHVQCVDILVQVLFGARTGEKVGTAGGGRLRAGEVDDGNAPLAPVMPRESHKLHVNEATPRKKYRKNPRGPVTREQALRWFRELGS